MPSATAPGELVGCAPPSSAPTTASSPRIILFVALVSLVSLALLGAIAARTGGASLLRGALRVTFWGALALVVTALIGRLCGTAV